MQGLILAAGLGKRLKELTHDNTALLHNDEAERIAQANLDKYLFFRYITAEAATFNPQPTTLNLLKFHPRREKYTPEQVIAAIARMKPKAVMIDTLNEPGWVAYDYWKGEGSWERRNER